MANPLFQQMRNTQPQGFNSMMSPQQMVTQALQQNPQLRQQLQFMQNQARTNGLTDEQYVKQWFRQQQIPEQQMIDIASKFGLR